MQERIVPVDFCWNRTCPASANRSTNPRFPDTIWAMHGTKWAICTILSLSLLGAAAADSGSLDGKVVNKIDQPVSAINLRLFSTQIQVERGHNLPNPQSSFESTPLGGAGQGKPIASVTSAQDGAFKFDRVPPGTYQLIVAPTATTGAFRQNVKIDANQTTHLQIKLGEPEKN
jgi:Carboxypeptidase regulatory-like domain